MSEELNQPDDQAILALLATLERGQGGTEPTLLPPGEGSESAETLTRLYTEVLGLLPYEAEPTAPPATIKHRLMAIVRGEDLGEDAGHLHELQDMDFSDLPDLAPVPALAERRPRPVPQNPQNAAGTPGTAVKVAVPAAPVAPVVPAMTARPSRPASRWPLALAASLALAAFGLAGYLFFQKSNLEGQIAELKSQRNQVIADVKAAQASLEAANAKLATTQSEIADAKARLSFMTTPGVEVSSLKPTGKMALPEDASGMLFVAADHQHWHLSVRGLAPADKGHHYQLWFVAPTGAVSGGVFSGGPGDPVHLSSAHMPPGTTAVIITLEPETGAKAPTGPECLRAAPPVKLL